MESMDWLYPWDGAAISIGETLTPEQLASVQGLPTRWNPGQPAVEALSEPVPLHENPNVEWLADTLCSPKYSPMTDGGHSTVQPGRKFLQAAWNTRTHTSLAWHEHMELLDYKKEALRKLAFAGWTAGQDNSAEFEEIYSRELQSVATPPIRTETVYIQGGGFEMIESLITETEAVRSTHLRNKTILKYDANGLIHTQYLIASEDVENPNAGESNVEGNIRPEQSLCKRLLKLLPPAIRPAIYFPQTIKGPFTGDRLFATDIVENEVEELRLDLEGNEAERKEWREWRRQGVQAAQAESSTSAVTLTSVNLDITQIYKQDAGVKDTAYKPGKMPKDEDEIGGKISIQGRGLLELKSRSAFTWEQIVALLTGLIELLKQGKRQGVIVEYDGLEWKLEWLYPDVPGATATNGHKLAQVIAEIITCNLSMAMISCLEWFLVVRPDQFDCGRLAFDVSPAMRARNPVFPHFKAMSTLALVNDHPLEIAPIGQRRSQPLYRMIPS